MNLLLSFLLDLVQQQTTHKNEHEGTVKEGIRNALKPKLSLSFWTVFHGSTKLNVFHGLNITILKL